MDLGGPLDLQVDPAEAEKRKRARTVQINVVAVPRLRAIGFVMLTAGVLLHNVAIYPGPAAFRWPDAARIVATFGVYCAVTWYLLFLFFEDALRVEIGRAHV